MKNILIVLVMLLACNVYAHDDGGFYVIPTGRVIQQEVCNGTPIGNGVFVLNISPSSYQYLYTGDVYATTTGHLVLITGDRYGSRYDSGSSFRVAPSTLPPPRNGVKGPYYFIDNDGDYVFAKFL